MIHFIIILHFATVTVGVITLVLIRLQYVRCKEQVFKEMFLADILFTFNMVLDSIRIYIAKNVNTVPPVLWMTLEFLLYILSTATILASTKLISVTTGKTLPSKLLWGFAAVFLAPMVAGVIENMTEASISQYIVTACFVYMLISCIVYGLYCIPLAETKYRSIVIVFTTTLTIYLPILIFTSPLLGMPAWIHKIPYFQIIYATLNILCLVYMMKTVENPVSQVANDISPVSTNDVLVQLCKEFNLTGRELEIITEVAEGKNNKQIGDQLFISPNTVKNHVYNIYKKMGVKNRYELIALISRNSQK